MNYSINVTKTNYSGEDFKFKDVKNKKTWAKINYVLFENILKYLSPFEICAFQRISPHWYKALRSDTVWPALCREIWPILYSKYLKGSDLINKRTFFIKQFLQFNPTKIASTLLREGSVIAPIGDLIAFDKDTAISCIASETILKVWNVTSGKLVKVLWGDDPMVSLVKISKRLIASCSKDSMRVKIWSVLENRVYKFLWCEKAITPLMATFKKNSIITTSHDHVLTLWNFVRDKKKFDFVGHTARISGIVVLKHYIISSSYDGTLRLWDGLSGKFLRVLKGYDSSPITKLVAFNKKCVLSGSKEGVLSLWDVFSGKELNVFSLYDSTSVTALAVLNERFVAVGFADGTIKICDILVGKNLSILKGHSSKISALIALNMKCLISCSADGRSRVWSYPSFGAV